jgi:hypothetical protein
MKNKSILAVAALLFVFTVTSITISAQPQRNGKGKQQSTRVNYVDKNNDGVCDNRAANANQQTNARRANYVDKNNDGVCDNQGNSKKYRQSKNGNCNRTGNYCRRAYNSKK